MFGDVDYPQSQPQEEYSDGDSYGDSDEDAYGGDGLLDAEMAEPPGGTQPFDGDSDEETDGGDGLLDADGDSDEETDYAQSQPQEECSDGDALLSSRTSDPDAGQDVSDLVVEADKIQTMSVFLPIESFRNVVARGTEAVRIIAASSQTHRRPEWLQLMEAFESTRFYLQRAAQAADMMNFFLDAMERLRKLNPENEQFYEEQKRSLRIQDDQQPGSEEEDSLAFYADEGPSSPALSMDLFTPPVLPSVNNEDVTPQDDQQPDSEEEDSLAFYADEGPSSPALSMDLFTPPVLPSANNEDVTPPTETMLLEEETKSDNDTESDDASFVDEPSDKRQRRADSSKDVLTEKHDKTRARMLPPRPYAPAEEVREPTIDLSGFRYVNKEVTLASLVEEPLGRVRRMLPSDAIITIYEKDDGDWNDQVDVRYLAGQLLATVRQLEQVAIDTPLVAVLLRSTPLGRSAREKLSAIWKVMRLILNRNRGYLPRNADGSRSKRRIRDPAFVEAENMLKDMANTLFDGTLVTGDLDFELAQLKNSLLARRREVMGRTTKRALDSFEDLPPDWVVALRTKLYKSAEEQLKLAKWTYSSSERRQLSAEAAARSSVALSAIDEYLKIVESRLQEQDSQDAVAA